MTARIALATCDALPELADDEPLLLEELRARGVNAQPEVWDDPGVDWASYELVVVRCTWDYAPRRGEFLTWASSVPRLLNTAEIIEWNTNKEYLAELPHVVPTAFLVPGERLEPPPGEYVVKPAISAGSRDTARYGVAERRRADAHATELLAAGRTVMVQPYLNAVDRHGETALIFFGGEYSHAIRKGQMLEPGKPPADALYVEEQIESREPTRREREVAEEVLDSLRWGRRELLYARVDLIPDDQGEPRLVELELTEPSLFFSYRPGAAARLADEVMARL